jgi:hypothetical protein
MAVRLRYDDVVVDEIAPGKFITMTYLAVDPARSEVVCANAKPMPWNITTAVTLNIPTAASTLCGHPFTRRE